MGQIMTRAFYRIGKLLYSKKIDLFFQTSIGGKNKHIQQLFLDSGFVPITLETSDVGKNFIYVFGNIVRKGTFVGFNNNNKSFALFNPSATLNNETNEFNHETVWIPNRPNQLVGVSRSDVNPKKGFDVFREDEIKFKEAKVSLNKLISKGRNPFSTDPDNLKDMKDFLGGKKRKNSKKSKKRKTNKKRKMSRRR